MNNVQGQEGEETLPSVCACSVAARRSGHVRVGPDSGWTEVCYPFAECKQ